MNREDLMGARRHAERMEQHYKDELKPKTLPCGCPGQPLMNWQVELAQRSAREFRAAVEAIDMALKTLEATDAA